MYSTLIHMDDFWILLQQKSFPSFHGSKYEVVIFGHLHAEAEKGFRTNKEDMRLSENPGNESHIHLKGTLGLFHPEISGVIFPLLITGVWAHLVGGKMILLFLRVGYVIVPSMVPHRTSERWSFLLWYPKGPLGKSSRYWSICEGGALVWIVPMVVEIVQDFSSSWLREAFWKTPCHVARNSSLVDWNSCPEDHTVNGAYEESLVMMRWWFQKCLDFHSEIENYPRHLFWVGGFTRGHSITENNKQCKSVQQGGPLLVVN